MNRSSKDCTLGGIYGNLWFIASWWQPWLAKGSEVRAVFWDWALNLWALCKVQIDSFWIELDWCQGIGGLLSAGKAYPHLVGLPSQRYWESSVSRQNTEEFSLYISLYNNGKFCLAHVFRDLSISNQHLLYPVICCENTVFHSIGSEIKLVLKETK